MVFGSITLVILVQPENTDEPRKVTLLGIFTSPTIPVQYAKASVAILVILFGIVTFVISVQLANAPPLICSTV
jgi:hypothetical protein